MSVTNGYLRLTADDLAQLRKNAAEFEARCRDDRQGDYLDMDKAGYELLFILDPASIDFDNPDADSPYPALAEVLGGGEAIHEDVDLGYGPARIVSDQAVTDALRELDGITLTQMTSMALESELLPDVLMCDVDAATIKQYHWPYLQSLAEFLREAKQRDMAVLRY